MAQASKALFQRCAVTMNIILKSKSDILKFLADDTEDEVDALLFKRILVAMHLSRCSSCNKPRDGKLEVVSYGVDCGPHGQDDL